MIDVIAQTGKNLDADSHSVEFGAKLTHPEWAAWIEASAYTYAQARAELDLANGTFYRRIAKAPTHIDRLAMRALYEGLEPFTTKDIAP